MPPYTKVHPNWSNRPSTATPIDADALDQMEQGIADAADSADSAASAASTAAGGLAAHLADISDAHDATAISASAVEGAGGANVQAVLESLQANIDAAGGVVDTIVEGTGISVDATDPANPVVTADFDGLADIYAAWSALGVNAKDPAYGALGDGIANDAAAIQAALDACSNAGGGTVYLPEGTYMVSLAELDAFPGFFGGLSIPSKVALRGAGENATIIKLIAGETASAATDGASIIYNGDLDGAGDVNVGIMDLTVDGDSANQSTVHNGITMIRTRGARFTRVTVRNVRGTASSGASETFLFDTQLGMDTTYTDCTARRDAGSTASGFSANNATGVHYQGCIASGMTASMGFTHFECQEVHYTNCHAYLNAVNGFNSEESRDVSYVGCHAGGEVADGDSPWPLAAAATLGNTGAGFVINGTKAAVLSACTSRKNATGYGIVEGSAGASGRMVGCSATDNTTSGVTVSSAASVPRWHFEANEVLNNNSGSTEYDLPTGWTDGPGVQLSTPAVPSSGSAFTNPYPFPVTVYITAPGTITLLRVNGADLDVATKMIRLIPGMNINIFYSAAPSWLWFGG